MSDLLIPAVALAVAAFVQGVTGFGFGMVAMGFLPLVLPVRVAVPAVAVLGAISTTVVLYENRRGLRRAVIAPLLIGSFIGVPIGVLFLNEVDPRYVRMTLGVVLLIYSIHGLASRRTLAVAPPVRSRWRDAVGTAAATMGGVLGAAFNTGGPPVILYITWRRFGPEVMKSSLQCFFLVSTAYQLSLFVASDTLPVESLETAAIGLPALGVGLWSGMRIGRRLDAAAFRRIVLVVLLLLGIRFVVV